jgi:hypothetical protein
LRHILPAIVLFGVSCGDPLAGADYRGEAIFKLEGQISTVQTLPDELRNAEFAVSMFWSPDEPAGTTRLIEQPSVTTTVHFPSTFILRVFEAPAEEHFPSADALAAFGLVLIYVDANGDRHYDRTAGDSLVGGSLLRGLLYAREDLEAAESPSGEALAAGFNVVDLPLDPESCMMSMPPPRGDGFDGPIFGCAEGGRCPPGAVCDPEDRICVASGVFELVILNQFLLERAFCRPPP